MDYWLKRVIPPTNNSSDIIWQMFHFYALKHEKTTVF